MNPLMRDKLKLEETLALAEKSGDARMATWCENQLKYITKRTLQILCIQARLLRLCKMQKTDSARSKYKHPKEGDLR